MRQKYASSWRTGGTALDQTARKELKAATTASQDTVRSQTARRNHACVSPAKRAAARRPGVSGRAAAFRILRACGAGAAARGGRECSKRAERCSTASNTMRAGVAKGAQRASRGARPRAARSPASSHRSNTRTDCLRKREGMRHAIHRVGTRVMASRAIFHPSERAGGASVA